MATVVDCKRYSDQSIYTVNVYGSNVTVTVTATASVVKKWIETALSLRGNYYLKLDFILGFAVDPDVNTLQFCIYHSCLIFQLAHADSIPQSLRDFIYDCRFAGFKSHWIQPTLMSSKYTLKILRNPEDLTRWDLPVSYGNSLDEIVFKLFGIIVNHKEEIRVSDWSVQNLSDDQVAYACLETHFAYIIARDFNVSCFPQLP